VESENECQEDSVDKETRGIRFARAREKYRGTNEMASKKGVKIKSGTSGRASRHRGGLQKRKRGGSAAGIRAHGRDEDERRAVGARYADQ
jgi:type IV secretory pathway TrbL component